jgi:hypothetical protein
MKTCNADNCSNPQFGGGYCRYHAYMRRMKGGDLYARGQKKPVEPRSGLKRTKVSPVSEKRKEQAKTYKQVKDEIRAELISTGNYNCFFCGKPMNSEKGFHHTKGRDGTKYIEKKWLVPGHNQCHVWDYHQAKIKDLIEQPWYPAFLSRLRDLDEGLYQTELKKQEKGLLFSDE